MNVKKDLGMSNDRIFAFSRGVDFEKANSIEQNPNERKLNLFLTLKNSPVLNKYNFNYENNKLTLTCQDKEIIAVNPDNLEERSLLSDKLSELEKSTSSVKTKVVPSPDANCDPFFKIGKYLVSGAPVLLAGIVIYSEIIPCETAADLNL